MLDLPRDSSDRRTQRHPSLGWYSGPKVEVYGNPELPVAMQMTHIYHVSDTPPMHGTQTSCPVAWGTYIELAEGLEAKR